jgi:hypothetical protein
MVVSHNISLLFKPWLSFSWEMTDTPLTLFFETFEMVSESHSETQNWPFATAGSDIWRCLGARRSSYSCLSWTLKYVANCCDRSPLSVTHWEVCFDDFDVSTACTNRASALSSAWVSSANSSHYSPINSTKPRSPIRKPWWHRNVSELLKGPKRKLGRKVPSIASWTEKLVDGKI